MTKAEQQADIMASLGRLRDALKAAQATAEQYPEEMMLRLDLKCLETHLVGMVCEQGRRFKARSGGLVRSIPIEQLDGAL